ncbi:MAG: hypothetical protein A2504_11755 [Bdellovibrionales bacterium RIFOXYD12_FULL_39_22]|nr:MAG: hypothetical protein A2385_16270 [Bdellovibrionales bacterium RIFOXYB1_FULL_39_21]OFZ44487.1 MAG: hypothetical protein A2485_06625 [Bdellovibrionales bacterium RIFOXYC12_FULL_39_17]OFZ49871.1 MAG: hypothetical protein A2404_00840 [Bdellovibrionales bacterium RIFOXYC1_FULL_39_130]OFZ76876.1 MAG: hypothetical protein A2560_05640 [Bdellovibrionales bacterium RIFOXYD1_FULL_39_84]OFZ95803.1 MAG: hypothetical protein A2504_11755 [Bdellovibrionales bacterium RIFOXYD12_FULL_39_22]HLE10822.1 hy
MKENIYQKQIEMVLPRILALFDKSPQSKTYGLADRFYWGWKLIDFPNGTFQGAVHGLARLVNAGLIPLPFSEKKIIQRILSAISATKKITRSNGSLEEAFPYESSFCVTALVAYDFLAAYELLGGRLNAEEQKSILETVSPLINFIIKNDETHAVISNHLATAVAAIFYWEKYSKKSCDGRGEELLKIILDNQSSEGWFSEYGGADPGYQTLATYYLADVYRLRPAENLKVALNKSLEFLRYCVHPDGSFGGIYGSRNTRFFYPAGLEFLKDHLPAANYILGKMRESISKLQAVTLVAMDGPNLAPMFNSYAWAAAMFGPIAVSDGDVLSWTKYFPKAGLYLKSTPEYLFWLSTRKGAAWGKHYKATEKKALGDFGALWQGPDGEILTGQEQAVEISINGDKIITKINLVLHSQMLPSPIKFLILRFLNLTLMRIPFFLNLIKKILVRLLITKQQKVISTAMREFDLAQEVPLVKDICQSDYKNISGNGPFYAIHMASQGYWQVSDDT